MIGGFNLVDGSTYTYLDSVEVLDLSGQSTNCQPVANYPRPVARHAGDLVGGRPRGCGGTSDGVASTDLCYEYLHETSEWEVADPMLAARYDYRSSVVDSATWLVTGGWDGSMVFDTTEVWRDGEFTPGPRLPQPLYGHCQLTVNSSQVLVLGGYNGTGYSPSVYLLDWQGGEGGDWRQLAEFSEHLHVDACGLIENSLNGQELVALPDHDSCQIYNFRDDAWRAGPPLQEGILYDSAVVQRSKSFVIVGGGTGNASTDSVYEFDPEGYLWVRSAATLRTARGTAVAVAVDDDHVECS